MDNRPVLIYIRAKSSRSLSFELVLLHWCRGTSRVGFFVGAKSVCIGDWRILDSVAHSGQHISYLCLSPLLLDISTKTTVCV